RIAARAGAKAARFGLLVNPNNTTAEEVKQEMTVAASSLRRSCERQPPNRNRLRDAGLQPCRCAHCRCRPILLRPPIRTGDIGNAPWRTQHLQDPRLSGGRRLDELWNEPNEVYSYAGRILKGTKPADLPVVQTTKFLSSTCQPPVRSASRYRRCGSRALTR